MLPMSGFHIYFGESDCPGYVRSTRDEYSSRLQKRLKRRADYVLDPEMATFVG